MKSLQTILMLGLSALLFGSCTKSRVITDPGHLVPKTVDQDPLLPSIFVNGAKLHSEAFGHPDSSLVVVIHGGPGGDYRDLLNCQALANHGYRVIFYDQRGSGLSQRFSKSFYTSKGAAALDVMYQDLAGVIAHYRKKPDQKVFLLGHSWGAILATGYAGRYSTAVDGLVVAEPGGLKWADIEDYVKRSRSFKLWGETLNDATYIDQFLTGKEDQHEILDYKMAMQASKNEITGEDNTKAGSSWRSGATINAALFEVGEDHSPDFSNGINQYGPHVLFLYSEQNKAYPQSWAENISTPYRNKELFKVNGVGHGGIISDIAAWSQVTMPRILTYLNSL